MIRLHSTDKKLQALLGGAVTTNQLPVTVMYSDKTSTNYAGAAQITDTNDGTAVDICNAPAASTVRDIDYISVVNEDTVDATVTIRHWDNGTTKNIVTVTLGTGYTLQYVHGDGWRVLDDTGRTVTSTSTASPSFSGTTTISDLIVTGTSDFTGLMTGVDADFTGDITALTAVLGEPGTEAGGINVHGTTYSSHFKVSDINDSHIAHSILHRHSTTLPSVLVGARSNSNGSSHAAVTAGQDLFTIYGTGRSTSYYNLFGSITFSVSASGSLSDTSCPGKITINVTPDGSFTPATAVTIENDKAVTIANHLGITAAPHASWTVKAVDYNAATGALAFFDSAGDRQTWLMNNVYYDGSFRYAYTDDAAMLRLSNGTISLRTAASGTAGNSISFVDVLQASTTGIYELKFQPTQTASSDANTLDDYEEGTWTPVIYGTSTAGTGTYTSQLGTYTKIGRVVHITMQVAITAHTGTGNMRISGLPFAASLGTIAYAPLAGPHASNVTLSANNHMICGIYNSQSYIELLQEPTGGGAQGSVPMDTSCTIYAGGTYQAAT